jgi:hypothetical protein
MHVFRAAKDFNDGNELPSYDNLTAEFYFEWVLNRMLKKAWMPSGFIDDQSKFLAANPYAS